MISSRPVILGLALLGLGLMPSLTRAETLNTLAREAIVIDEITGTVLFEKDADKRVPPASMSKLMTVYMVFDKLKKGELRLDDTFPVSENAWRMQGSKMFVELNSRIAVKDLLRGVIVQSGNDACIVLAEGIAGNEQAFADMMNAKAKEIGLQNSQFVNATGWPDPDHMMTMRDLSTLAHRLMVDFPEYYPIFAEKEFTWHGIKQGNRNPLLYKNLGVDGLKTGHIEDAGYGLTGSALRDGRRIIFVIHGLDGMQSRSDEAERVVDWAFRNFENHKVATPGTILAEVSVRYGEAQTVKLTTKDQILMTLPRGQRDKITAVAVVDNFQTAPIQKGQPMGKLIISAPDLPNREVALVAAEDVERMGAFERIATGLGYLLGGS